MIKILAHIYYVGQIITYGGLVIWALSMVIRGLFCGAPAFINICFAIMACTTYCLMYVPSVREYKEHKARHNKKTQTEQK